MAVATPGDWSGLSATPAVINNITRAVAWNWYHFNPDAFQFAHSGHKNDESWIDVDHPDYPL